ncbi:transcription factor E2F6 isoform 1-T1 [Synchiropus picturatus]
MVKCVVTGCPNRQQSGSRTTFSRTTKRFFKFPEDPARVKVWLAALRETDRQDWDQHQQQQLICEDHFLPEDLSASGVNDDAIPLMPPDLDGALGLSGSWNADSSDGEDLWDAGDQDEEEEPATTEPAAAEVVAAESLQEGSEGTWQTSAAQAAGEEAEPCGQSGARGPGTAGLLISAAGADLGPLALRVLELLLSSPDRTLDLRQAALDLHAGRRQVCDVVDVLEGVRLVDRTKHTVRWISPGPVSGFLWKNPEEMVGQVQELKMVEETLDGLIKTCSWQLFQMTDDPGHASLAYVTHRDLTRLGAFQDQTLFLVKAPEETKLEVPAPTEDSIKIHLKGVRGPIVVLTCDVVSDEQSSDFTPLEQSRVRTRALSTDSHQPLGGAITHPQS